MKPIYFGLIVCLIVSGCDNTPSVKGPPATPKASETAPAPSKQPITGPFGLAMATPLSELSVVKKLSGNFYEIKVPLPNSEFANYLATVTDKDGLCKIVAIGKTYENDKAGTETREAYDRVKSILGEKYGPSKTFDYLRSGAIWDKSYEWAASIDQKERTLTDFWDREEKSRMPPDISSINLRVASVSLHALYIRLSYEFQNMKKCVEPEAARNKQAL